MYNGEVGVMITLPTNNPSLNISTMTCTMVVKRPDSSIHIYAATALGDGSGATFITTGAEFPVAGSYDVGLHVTDGVNLYKSRVQLQVAAAIT